MATETFNIFQSAIKMDLKLYYCGVEHSVSDHTWGPGVQEHFKIHYVNSGKGTFVCADQTYSLSKGEAFLISPNIPCFYKADHEDPWTYSWVAFNGLHAEMYIKRTQLSHKNPIIRCKEELVNPIEDCFQQMFEARHHEVSRDMKLLSSFYSFLAMIVDTVEHQGAMALTNDTKEQYINQAVGYIEANYSNNITIEDIAKELNLNRKYMSKLFKEFIGWSPQHYLMRYRMNRACNLLKNPLLQIGEISQSVGYQDQLFFTRIFKSLVGCSPTQYRKNLLIN
jgi:AraC-like DNA-binding protein